MAQHQSRDTTPTGKFYAVARGRKPDIYTSPSECSAEVIGFSNSKCKRFATRRDAEEFMAQHRSPDPTSPNRLRTDDQNGSGDNETSCLPVNRDVIIPAVNSSDQGSFLDAATSTDIGDENIPDSLVYVVITGKKKTVCKFSDIRAGETFKTFSTEDEALEYKYKETFLIYQDVSDGVKHGRVWTDGSSKPFGKDYVAGIGVYWGPNDPNNFSLAPLPGWNQGIGRAELMAVNHAIRGALEKGMTVVTVYTDSEYVEKCAGKWISYWEPRNWIKADGTPVANKNELIELLALMRIIDVRFEHVNAHSGDPNNTAADRLATQAVGKFLQQREQASRKARRLQHPSGNSVDSGRSSPFMQSLDNQEERIRNGGNVHGDRVMDDQVAHGAEGTENGENHDINLPNQVAEQETNGNGHSVKDKGGEDIFESESFFSNFFFGDNE